MSEHSANVEIAHRIHEDASESGESGQQPSRRREEILEIAQAVLLALVAIATAFSGYQAAKWDSTSAQLYGQSSRLRSMAAQAETTAGQLYLYDTTTFNFWLNATANGQVQLAGVYQSRFRPEFRVAFDAWIALNPLQNPGTPPGPSFMPQYHVSQAERAATLDTSASSAFDAASAARDDGDEYVRVTVFLAAVLFLVAVSQRFRIVRIRIGVLVVALLFLGYSLFTLASLPHG
jgi:hypothetical protein